MNATEKNDFNSYSATVARIKHLKSTWHNMNYRCNGKRVSLRTQRAYQEKGISVCDEWKDNFATFYDWSVENGYEYGLTIDRIDPNGDYCPENCRWITFQENRSNRTRKSDKSSANGKSSFYKNYLRLCLEKGVAPSKAAKNMGFSSCAPTNWKHGRIPFESSLIRMSNYFGCTIEELIAEDNGKEAGA